MLKDHHHMTPKRETPLQAYSIGGIPYQHRGKAHQVRKYLNHRFNTESGGLKTRAQILTINPAKGKENYILVIEDQGGYGTQTIAKMIEETLKPIEGIKQEFKIKVTPLQNKIAQDYFSMLQMAAETSTENEELREKVADLEKRVIATEQKNSDLRQEQEHHHREELANKQAAYAALENRLYETERALAEIVVLAHPHLEKDQELQEAVAKTTYKPSLEERACTLVAPAKPLMDALSEIYEQGKRKRTQLGTVPVVAELKEGNYELYFPRMSDPLSTKVTSLLAADQERVLVDNSNGYTHLLLPQGKMVSRFLNGSGSKLTTFFQKLGAEVEITLVKE